MENSNVNESKMEVDTDNVNENENENENVSSPLSLSSPASRKRTRPGLLRQPSEKHPYRAGAASVRRLATSNDQKSYNTEEGISRKRTEVEDQVLAKEVEAELIVESLPKDSESVPEVNLYLPELLCDAVFVGHLVTDLDSVAGAIGAATLYGGTPALASKINSETQFALDYWKVDLPKTLEDILKETPEADICLVDHQQTSQMNPNIKADRIVGVIDHHALQSKTIVTDKPIYIDIRPWGSMSTIVAHTFLTNNRRPSKPIAGMLLCAILSDTLNLLGPTTTDWDRLLVAVLSDIAEVDDIQLLASQQFKAKSKELAALSPHALVNGDQKTFTFSGTQFNGDVGFAVVETTDDAAILERIDELLPEMVACKKEKGLSMLFLAVVNIVELKSCLLLCGPAEVSLAQAAFDGPFIQRDNNDEESTNDDTVDAATAENKETLMDLGKRVSRKKDFIPVLTRTIKEGWSKTNIPRGPSTVSLDKLGKLEVDPADPHGKVMRVGSVLLNPLDAEKIQNLVLEDLKKKKDGTDGDEEQKAESGAFMIG